MKVLVATEKPFAAVAVDGIRKVLDEAGYELALLEKYSSKQELLDAVADADVRRAGLEPRQDVGELDRLHDELAPGLRRDPARKVDVGADDLAGFAPVGARRLGRMGEHDDRTRLVHDARIHSALRARATRQGYYRQCQ